MTPYLRSEQKERSALGSRRSFVAFDIVGLLHTVVDFTGACALRGVVDHSCNPVEVVRKVVLPTAL